MAENLAKIKFAIYNSTKKWCFVGHGDNYLQAFTLVVGETRAISQQISNDLKRASGRLQQENDETNKDSIEHGGRSIV